MKNQPGFFDFAAEVGLTKHIGSVEATECQVGRAIPPGGDPAGILAATLYAVPF